MTIQLNPKAVVPWCEICGTKGDINFYPVKEGGAIGTEACNECAPKIPWIFANRVSRAEE